MKKKYYRYLIYFLLTIIIGVSGIYFLAVRPFDLEFFGESSANQLDNDSGSSSMVIALNKKAFNLRLSDPQNTIKLADSALKIAMKTRFIPGAAESHRVIGVGFSYVENNSFAIKNYLEAIRLFKQLGDDKSLARTYSNIGNLYKYNDPDKALKYFHKASTIALHINDQELVAGIYFNIALVYSRKSQYSKSLIFFDKSCTIFNKLKDTVSKIIYLQNTGRVYHKMHQLDSATSRLIKAVAAAKDRNLYSTLSGCYLSLSYVYLEQSDFKRTEETIAEGLKYAQKVNNAILDNDFVRVKYELELKRKNYPKALKYLTLAYRNDSLLLNENQSLNIDINSRHYLQQQEIQEKALIITEQTYRVAKFRWIVALSILILLLTVVAVIIVYFLKEKLRKSKEIIVQNSITSLEQKALQAMMNPHFVFNLMNSVQHFINQADIKSANQALSGFARLARKHLELCMNSTISLHEELLYLELYLSMEKIRFSDKMNYEIIIDEDIDTEEILIPSMLIQPFLENAIWHGIMPKEEGGTIKLNFKFDEIDLFVTIIDDGIGILNSERISKSGHISRGMALIRERVTLLNKLNERHIFINQHQTGDYGTEVSIRIPA